MKASLETTTDVDTQILSSRDQAGVGATSSLRDAPALPTKSLPTPSVLDSVYKSVISTSNISSAADAMVRSIKPADPLATAMADATTAVTAAMRLPAINFGTLAGSEVARAAAAAIRPQYLADSGAMSALRDALAAQEKARSAILEPLAKAFTTAKLASLSSVLETAISTTKFGFNAETMIRPIEMPNPDSWEMLDVRLPGWPEATPNSTCEGQTSIEAPSIAKSILTGFFRNIGPLSDSDRALITFVVVSLLLSTLLASYASSPNGTEKVLNWLDWLLRISEIGALTYLIAGRPRR